MYKGIFGSTLVMDVHCLREYKYINGEDEHWGKKATYMRLIPVKVSSRFIRS